MSRLADHLVLVVVTLWIGGMWAVGYVVAPVLFDMVHDRALAGRVAGRLFDYVGWFGLVASAWLALLLAVRLGWGATRSGLFWLVLLMLAMVAAGHFGIQPLMAQLKALAWPNDVMNSVMRDRFSTWHGISSVLYLMQSVVGVVLVARMCQALRQA